MKKPVVPRVAVRVPPSYDAVRAAANAVTKALAEMGVTAAIFGSLAHKMYGNARTPTPDVRSFTR